MPEETAYHLTINGIPKCKVKDKLSDTKKRKATENLAKIGKKFVCHYYITDESEIHPIENAVQCAMPGAVVKLVEGYHATGDKGAIRI